MQEPVGGPEAVSYSRLYPPRRHRQQPPASRSKQWRRLQWKDYRAEGRRTTEDHDTCHRRVIPPLPHPVTCQLDSTASATTACSQAASGSRTHARERACSMSGSQYQACDAAGPQADQPQRSPSVPVLRRWRHIIIDLRAGAHSALPSHRPPAIRIELMTTNAWATRPESRCLL